MNAKVKIVNAKVKIVNAKVKMKMNAAKVRVKEKAKKAKRVKRLGLGVRVMAAVLMLLAAGCMDTNPASRATSSTDRVGAITARLEDCANCTVSISITKADSALASADSSGSTETQTAQPTQTVDVRPTTDVNTTGGRTAGVLESVVGAFGTWLTTPDGQAACAPCADAACAGGNCTDK